MRKNLHDIPVVRREQFFMQLICDSDLNPRTHSVAWIILSCINHKSGYSFPGIEFIAQKLSVNEKTVRLRITELERRGWLRVVKRPGRSAIYYPNYERANMPGVSEAPREICEAGPGISDLEPRARMPTEPLKEPIKEPLARAAASASPNEWGEPDAAHRATDQAGKLWWNHFDQIRAAFSVRDFEEFIDPLTPKHETSEILHMAAPSDHVAIAARNHRAVLGQIVGKKVIVTRTTEGLIEWNRRKKLRDTPLP